VATREAVELGSVDAVELRRFLDGENAIVRQHVRAVLGLPEFRRPATPPPSDQYREQVMQWAWALARTHGPSRMSAQTAYFGSN
jgi:hypothetical protein